MVGAHTSARKLYSAVSKQSGTDVDKIRLWHDGDRTFLSDTSLACIGIWDEPDTSPYFFNAIFEQRGGKPVIYLFPPEPMSVKVDLSLCPQCESSFALLTPVADVIRVFLSSTPRHSNEQGYNQPKREELGAGRVESRCERGWNPIRQRDRPGSRLPLLEGECPIPDTRYLADSLAE